MRAHTAILLGGYGVALFMLVGGGLIVASGEAFDYCTKSYTGAWGILPAMVGLVMLLVLSAVAWDKYA